MNIDWETEDHISEKWKVVLYILTSKHVHKRNIKSTNITFINDKTNYSKAERIV